MKQFTVADIFTYLNLLAGFSAVISILQGWIVAAGILLILAFGADFLDGWIAGKMRTARDFGKYLDSLADVCSFGFAPSAIAVVMYPGSFLIYITAGIFLIAGVFRLARYQASSLKRVFQGVPITINGLVFGILLILSPFLPVLASWMWACCFLIMAFLMVIGKKVKHV